MKKSRDTRIGISVNKNNADRKFQMRDTVFRKGSGLNSQISTRSNSVNPSKPLPPKR